MFKKIRPISKRNFATKIVNKSVGSRWSAVGRPSLSILRLFAVLIIANVLLLSYCALSTPRLKPATTYYSPIKPTAAIGMPRSQPIRIVIPRIGVDTDVIPVGLLADGSLATPPVLSEVAGWYVGGPSPGEIGPSVIDAHLVTYASKSVFWRLKELLPEDKIIITRADGSIVTFAVEALQEYSQDNFGTQEVYGAIDHPGLRLITCGGSFDRATGHYTKNTVIFASIVKS